jgi:histone acetyltransferase (RNA polymerase elongator complex component)
MSRELLRVMKRAGFNSMMITPESASDRVLDEMQKGFSKDNIKHCADLVRESGIPSMWFFMLGARGETRETANETVSFAEQHLNRNNCLSVFTTGIRLLPGTELSCQAKSDGYLQPEQSLAESIFYFSPKVTERWLLQRVNRAARRCPTVVHAAEDPSSGPVGKRIFSLMHLLGIAPPYWRFIPRFLSLPFIHNARKRQSIHIRAPHTNNQSD